MVFQPAFDGYPSYEARGRFMEPDDRVTSTEVSFRRFWLYGYLENDNGLP